MADASISLGCRRRLVVELAVRVLVEDAVVTGPAAAHVKPSCRHEDYGPGTEVFRARLIGTRVPHAADDHVGDSTGVRMKRIVGACGHLPDLCVRPGLGI